MPRKKNPHAVALGRKGGKAGGTTGGKNRWKDVPKEERVAHMKKAAQARWKKLLTKQP